VQVPYGHKLQLAPVGGTAGTHESVEFIGPTPSAPVPDATTVSLKVHLPEAVGVHIMPDPDSVYLPLYVAVPPGARVKAPLAVPVHPVPHAIVINPDALGVSVMVMLLTWTFALLVMDPLKSTSIPRGLPLVTDVVQLLSSARHPPGVTLQLLEPLTSQEAPPDGPVSVEPSGDVPEARTRLVMLVELEVASKLPV
jgi:hypothetical protein